MLFKQSGHEVSQTGLRLLIDYYCQIFLVINIFDFKQDVARMRHGRDLFQDQRWRDGSESGQSLKVEGWYWISHYVLTVFYTGQVVWE